MICMAVPLLDSFIHRHMCTHWLHCLQHLHSEHTQNLLPLCKANDVAQVGDEVPNRLQLLQWVVLIGMAGLRIVQHTVV